MAKTNFRQGLYTPINPQKYVGDVTKIRFMSSWELNVHKFLDNNPNILYWNSEGAVIPYIKPTDGRVHHYLVDYYVQYKTRDGTIVEELWEVKPMKQVQPPKKTKRKNPKTLLLEQITHAVNVAKWQSATLYAQQRGWSFRILTEDQIFR